MSRVSEPINYPNPAAAKAAGLFHAPDPTEQARAKATEILQGPPPMNWEEIREQEQRRKNAEARLEPLDHDKRA